MPHRGTWVDRQVDVVLQELAGFDLVASRQHVAELIRDRVRIVADEVGVSERTARGYVTIEVLRDLARDLAFALADEQPGADLLEQPRTIQMPVATAGRTIAALAEAAHVRTAHHDEVGVHGALQLISLLGQILHERGSSSEPIFLPRAALLRGARLLEATSVMLVDSVDAAPHIPPHALPEMAAALTEDARILRALVAKHAR